MEKLTFEQLPLAVATLTKEVGDLKSLLLEKHASSPKEKPEQLLTVQETAQFLNLRVPTIYSKVSKGELPVMKRRGRLYFSSIELLHFLKEGRRKTNAEIEAEAESYLSKKKGQHHGR